MKKHAQPQLILLYHFFHPDDVISARLFTELGERAAAEGMKVLAMPSIWSCHDREARLPAREDWHGMEIRRVWRPAWRQGSNKGRIGNALAMLLGWTWRALWTRRSKNEVVVIGTDPPLSILVAIPWRLLRPRTKIVHWCHDLYPQAAVAEGILRADSWLVRGLNALLRVAYRRCDVIADLGGCMRGLLVEAMGEEVVGGVKGEGEVRGEAAFAERKATLTPWSLVEPEVVPEANGEVRKELFGDADLGLLYSGNLGRAHVYKPFAELARRLNGDSVGFCYAGRGPRMEELRSEVLPSDENVRFAGFASEEQLTARLAAADVHMVSLQSSWTGTVVPSKFFGSLAVGRPVLFAGSRRSAIAQWIERFQVGWVLEEGARVDDVAEALRAFAKDRASRMQMRTHCFEVYHQEFSKKVQMQRWREVFEGR